MHELHYVILDHLADANLLRAFVVRVLGYDQSKIDTILRELHVSMVYSLKD